MGGGGGVVDKGSPNALRTNLDNLAFPKTELQHMYQSMQWRISDTIPTEKFESEGSNSH